MTRRAALPSIKTGTTGSLGRQKVVAACGAGFRQ